MGKANQDRDRDWQMNQVQDCWTEVLGHPRSCKGDCGPAECGAGHGTSRGSEDV